MLVFKDLKNKNNSIYRCDKCRRKINVKILYRIFVETTEENAPKIKWHLCKECYKKICESLGE